MTKPNSKPNSRSTIKDSHEENPVIIDRSSLITEIASIAAEQNEDSPRRQRYLFMLQAILSQSNQNIKDLKLDMNYRLEEELCERLGVPKTEIAILSSPIKKNIELLIKALQEDDINTFNTLLQTIGDQINNRSIEQELVSIFEEDLEQQKISFIQTLTAKTQGANEQQSAFISILEKYLPAKIVTQIKGQLKSEASNQMQKYNAINDIIKHNSNLLPGITDLNDVIHMQAYLQTVAGSNTGASKQNIIGQVASSAKGLIDSLTSSHVAEALVPLKAYNNAAKILKISKAQLRAISHYSIAQLRQLVTDTEFMTAMKRKHPKVYKALINIKDNLLDAGKIEEFTSEIFYVVSKDRTLDMQMKKELLHFAQNIEDEALGTIITATFNDETLSGHYFGVQKLSVVYRMIRVAYKNQQTPLESYRSFTAGRAARQAVSSHISGIKQAAYPDTIKRMSILGLVNKLEKGGQIGSLQIPPAADLNLMDAKDLQRYKANYNATIQAVQQEVDTARKTFMQDIHRLKTNPTSEDLKILRARYNVDPNTTVDDILTEARRQKSAFDKKARKLSSSIKKQSTRLNAALKAIPQGMPGQRSIDNLDTAMRKGKLINVAKVGAFATLTLGSSAHGLYQGTMTAKQAAVTVGESVALMVPGLGTFLMVNQLWSGRSMSGQKLSNTEWWTTLGFTVLSAVTDALSLAGGIGIALKAGTIGAMTSVRSAPLLGRLAYHTTKMLTKGGRIQALARATNRADKITGLVKAHRSTANTWRHAEEGLGKIWQKKSFWGEVVTDTAKSGFLWKNTARAVAGTLTMTNRVFQTCLASIKGGLKTVTGGVAYLGRATQGIANKIYQAALNKNLKHLGQDDLKAAVKHIAASIKTEATVAKNIMKINRARAHKQTKDRLEQIKALKRENGTLIASTLPETLTTTVRSIIEVAEKGSNSAVLNAIVSGSTKGQKLINGVQTAIVGSMIGAGAIGLGYSAFGKGFTQGVSDTYSGLGTIAGAGADSAVYAFETIKSVEPTKERITRNINKRAAQLGKTKRWLSELRKLNNSQLARVYILDFDSFDPRLKQEFLNYINTKGLNTQTLITIFNTNQA
jgi:hypothetical protein